MTNSHREPQTKIQLAQHTENKGKLTFPQTNRETLFEMMNKRLTLALDMTENRNGYGHLRNKVNDMLCLMRRSEL